MTMKTFAWTMLLGASLSLGLIACESTEESDGNAEEGSEQTAGETAADHDWSSHEWQLEPVEQGTQAKLDKQNEQMSQMMQDNPELKADFEEGNQAVAAQAPSANALKAGDKAPGFDLPATYGEQTSLAGALKQGPAVIVFYRGSWCPYCNIHLADLDAAAPSIKAAGGQLIAISPELASATKWDAEQSFSYPVLSDQGNTVASEYGLVFELPEVLRPRYQQFGIDLAVANGDQSHTLPLAATYIVDTDGTIVWAFVQEDYSKRAEPQHILSVLEELQAN